MPNRTLHIVVVFGLDDGKYNFSTILSKVWNRKDVKLHPVRVGWRDGGGYLPKKQAVLELVDQLLATGDPVALIGISAGASLAVNIFKMRPALLGLVNVCGALRLANPLQGRIAKSVASSPAFQESLADCESPQDALGGSQLRRILILEPWIDFVPISTMTLRGAQVMRLAGVNHSVSIVTAMLLYRRAIVKFLKHWL